MAVYVYKARDRRGEILRDRTEGPSEAAVVGALRRKGLLVIEVREQNAWEGGLLAVFGRVTAEDLVLFTRQLATMVGAGLPLVRALRALAEQADGRRIGTVAEAVRADVEAGASLSGALAARGGVFPVIYVEMVRAGEAGGMLDEVLPRLASQLERDRELGRKVRSAMAYPITVLVLAALAAAFMLVFVVPVFARMFEDLGGVLPVPTRVAMALSAFLTGPAGLLFLGGGAFGTVLLVRWLRTAEGKEAWSRVSVRLPLGLGNVVRKVALARFARTFGALVSAGVPVLTAVEISGRSSGSPALEAALVEVARKVGRGSSIQEALEGDEAFPPMARRMVGAGEQAGQLDAMLERIAEFYEAEVEAAVAALTAIIEPLMIVVVGAIVGGIIVAMYLPMFRVFELIGQ
jgi:type IV pilus assembly protein PilC